MSSSWLLHAVAAGPTDQLAEVSGTLLEHGDRRTWAEVASRVDVPETLAVAACERLAAAAESGADELDWLAAREPLHPGVQLVLASTLTDRLPVFAQHLTAEAAVRRVLDRALGAHPADRAAADPQNRQMAAAVALSKLVTRPGMARTLTEAAFPSRLLATLTLLPGHGNHPVFRRLMPALFAWAQTDPAWVCSAVVTLGDPYLLANAAPQPWADAAVRAAFVADLAAAEPDGGYATLPAATLRTLFPLLDARSQTVVRELAARTRGDEDDWELRTLVSLVGASVTVTVAAEPGAEPTAPVERDAALLTHLGDAALPAHEAAGWALEHAVPPRVWTAARPGDDTFRRLMVLGDVDGLAFLPDADLVQALTWGLESAEGWSSLAHAAASLEITGVRDRCCASTLLWEVPWSNLVRWADLDTLVAQQVRTRLCALVADPDTAPLLLRLLDTPAAGHVPLRLLLAALSATTAGL